MTYPLPWDNQPNSASSNSTKLPLEWQKPFEQVMEADREFFAQHPDREYYIRPITEPEVVEGRSMGKAVTSDAYVLVGELAPGSRVRLTIMDGSAPPIEEFRTMKRRICKQMGIKPKKPPKQGLRPKAKGFAN